MNRIKQPAFSFDADRNLDGPPDRHFGVTSPDCDRNGDRPTLLRALIVLPGLAVLVWQIWAITTPWLPSRFPLFYCPLVGKRADCFFVTAFYYCGRSVLRGPYMNPLLVGKSTIFEYRFGKGLWNRVESVFDCSCIYLFTYLFIFILFVFGQSLASAAGRSFAVVSDSACYWLFLCCWWWWWRWWWWWHIASIHFVLG